MMRGRRGGRRGGRQGGGTSWKPVWNQCCPAGVRCRCSWTFGATGPGCSPSALATAGKLSRPYRGQLRQLGAQLEYPGRHDPRVTMVDTMKEPTKRKYYKYGCKEDALAAKKKRDNRTRRERRRRAVERLTAAQEEKDVTKQ